MIYIIHKDYGFEYETDIKKCNKKILEAQSDMPYRVKDGLSEFNCWKGSKEYRKYKGNLITCLLVYGLVAVGIVLDFLVNGSLTGDTGLLLLGAIVNSIFTIYYLFNYIPAKKWYDQQKKSIISAYQREWQRILNEYYDWCKKNNQVPLPNLHRDIDFIE